MATDVSKSSYFRYPSAPRDGPFFDLITILRPPFPDTLNAHDLSEMRPSTGMGFVLNFGEHLNVEQGHLMASCAELLEVHVNQVSKQRSCAFLHCLGPTFR
jgi:hypothetical protein